MHYPDDVHDRVERVSSLCIFNLVGRVIVWKHKDQARRLNDTNEIESEPD